MRSTRSSDGYAMLDSRRDHECWIRMGFAIYLVTLAGVSVYTYFVFTHSYRVTGDFGGTGEKGYTGPAGPTGGAGQGGVIGVNGTTGKTGPTGEQGIIGGQGIRGWNCWETNMTRMEGNVSMCVGPLGNLGFLGPTGPQGITGPLGPDGGLRGWDVLFTGTCAGLNDHNGDGVCNITDANGDVCGPSRNASQCPGPQGYQGRQGQQGITGPTGAANFTAGPTGARGCPCWDTDCDGTLSLQDIIAYNINGDGTLDTQDCIGTGVGATGDKGAQGLIGYTGVTGPDAALNPAASTDPNKTNVTDILDMRIQLMGFTTANLTARYEGLSNNTYILAWNIEWEASITASLVFTWEACDTTAWCTGAPAASYTGRRYVRVVFQSGAGFNLNTIGNSAAEYAKWVARIPIPATAAWRADISWACNLSVRFSATSNRYHRLTYELTFGNSRHVPVRWFFSNIRTRGYVSDITAREFLNTNTRLRVQCRGIGTLL